VTRCCTLFSLDIFFNITNVAKFLRYFFRNHALCINFDKFGGATFRAIFSQTPLATLAATARVTRCGKFPPLERLFI
jgi:hypothetical protein